MPSPPDLQMERYPPTVALDPESLNLEAQVVRIPWIVVPFLSSSWKEEREQSRLTVIAVQEGCSLAPRVVGEGQALKKVQSQLVAVPFRQSSMRAAVVTDQKEHLWIRLRFKIARDDRSRVPVTRNGAEIGRIPLETRLGYGSLRSGLIFF
jgi:hypothetical protein